MIGDFLHVQGDDIDLRPIWTGARDGHFHVLEEAARFSGRTCDLIVIEEGTTARAQGDVDGNGTPDIVLYVVTASTPLHAADFVLA